MRPNHLILSLLLCTCMTATAAAQPLAAPVPPQNQAAPPAAGAEPAAPAAASAAPAPSVAAQGAAAPPPPAANPFTAASAAESQRLARERWQMQVLRARAGNRVQQTTALEAEGTQPEEVAPPRVYGDAGAPIAVGASWDTPWYTDASYDVFSDKNAATRFGLFAAYDVASLRSDTIAALEVGWGTEHEKDSRLLGGALGTELTTHAFHGGAQVRWVPVSWLQPHMRLVGGAQFVSMALQTSQRFHDKGVSPFGSLGLGCTLRTPSRLFEDHQGKLAALSVGLMLEGGYTLASSLDFTADGPGPAKGAISLSDAKLGKLERSGPYVRASIVVRF